MWQHSALWDENIVLWFAKSCCKHSHWLTNKLLVNNAWGHGILLATWLGTINKKADLLAFHVFISGGLGSNHFRGLSLACSRQRSVWHFCTVVSLCLREDQMFRYSGQNWGVLTAKVCSLQSCEQKFTWLTSQCNSWVWMKKQQKKDRNVVEL